MTKNTNPAIRVSELLGQQKQISTDHVQLGSDTLNRSQLSTTLPAALLPLNNHIGETVALGLLRQELIGAIVARDPREYDDTPEAAVYLADDLLILFNIKSRA